MEQTRQTLTRQLSLRSTVKELVKRRILDFVEDVQLLDADAKDEYDRRLVVLCCAVLCCVVVLCVVLCAVLCVVVIVFRS
jgi:Flp pilus assembly protein TadB